MKIHAKQLFIAVWATIAVVGVVYFTQGARTRLRQGSKQLEVEWKERRKLEGNWQVIETQINGKPAPGYFRNFQFSGRTLTTERESRRIVIYSYTPDPENQPKEIDLAKWSNENDTAPLHGIYTLTHDTLTICWTTTDEARPTELRTEKGDRRTLILARRPDKRDDQP